LASLYVDHPVDIYGMIMKSNYQKRVATELDSKLNNLALMSQG